jgi:hypothetical protein
VRLLVSLASPLRRRRLRQRRDGVSRRGSESAPREFQPGLPPILAVLSLPAIFATLVAGAKGLPDDRPARSTDIRVAMLLFAVGIASMLTLLVLAEQVRDWPDSWVLAGAAWFVALAIPAFVWVVAGAGVVRLWPALLSGALTVTIWIVAVAVLVEVAHG